MGIVIALLILSIGVVTGGIIITGSAERDRKAIAERLGSYLK